MPPGLFTKQRRAWLLCVVVGVMALLYGWWPSRQSKPAPTPPSPNGYDDFIKASRLVASVSGDFSAMTTEELRVLFTANREPISLIRRGLERQCHIEAEFGQIFP
jgi:hypothetical protein